MYALVNANNMYVSCERVFRPALHGRPVIDPEMDGAAEAPGPPASTTDVMTKSASTKGAS